MTQLKALLNLGLTEEEALQVLEDDKRIDRGEKLFELNQEQKQTSSKLRRVVDPYGKTRTKERKLDEAKHDIFSSLLEFVKNDYENVEVTTADREFIFFDKKIKYKITLSKPRG